ncbi:MAG: IS3 family transposase [Thermodesulfovibrionales bacterium]
MGYSATLVLHFVGLKRSTYYYRIGKYTGIRGKSTGRPKPGYSYTTEGKKVSDEQIKEWLCQMISGEYEAYGYTKLTHSLRRDFKLIINRKKVYRLCKELDILKPQRKINPKHPRKIAKNRVVTAPNQLWEIDVKYGYIAGEDRFLFILPILDVCDRTVVDYHVGLACSAKDVVITLKQALFRRGLVNSRTKPIIRTDNGPQFISSVFQEACIELGLEHERIPFKTPNKNAHIESFNSILEGDCLSRHEFESFPNAYHVICDFMDFYNNRRIHSAIKYLTPMECHEAFKCNSMNLKPIAL